MYSIAMPTPTLTTTPIQHKAIATTPAPVIEKPQEIFLKDYAPPTYLVEQVDLTFELDETATTVRSRLEIRRNHSGAALPLELNGDEVELVSVRLNGRLLTKDEYRLEAVYQKENKLVIPDVPEFFTLEVETRINPQTNTALSGLFMSGGMFCTQCEPLGFRRMTYFVDRPDNMARYRTTIIADKSKYPVLLSNGNPVESRDLPGGKHIATWEDPFKKPSYLFALVAGDLVPLEDTFITRSGRSIALRIFVEAANLEKTRFAMEALKKAMQWDEEKYGREYDLDIFMIVAVDHFVFGAMENKGLNVFNAKVVLAKPETATDSDYSHILGVVAHEYFHNWSGNRVTCRDWFQLSLKEGFTVFRDQTFQQDMLSQGVCRIKDVLFLRGVQFFQDAGAMAHPVRPESFISVENFYTPTVYEKGAEVIRMMHTLLGPERFRRGADLYFERHDGQAVTCDDFVAAMADANDFDFGQFKLWYSQSGTPVLDIERHYDPATQTYTLKIRQSCPPTPGQAIKEAFHIPIRMGLLGSDGKDLPLQLEGESEPQGTTRVLELTNAETVFRFVNVTQEPVPSLLRGFSAPVKLNIDLTDNELVFLMANDSDDFNRWEAGQKMALNLALKLVDDYRQGRPLHLDASFTEAFRKILLDRSLDKQFAALALTLPEEAYICDQLDEIDPLAVHQTYKFMHKTLAQALKDDLQAVYHENCSTEPYYFDAASVGRRSLKNLCLEYLMELEEAAVIALCHQQFQNATNMTDQFSALELLANHDGPERQSALDDFYRQWQHDTLAILKWFAAQSIAERPDVLDKIRQLMEHPAFEMSTPNKVRALIRNFAENNTNNVAFHDPSGRGYEFYADQIIRMNAINAQVASGMAKVFARWKDYAAPYRELMRHELERLLATPDLCKEVYEVVKKSLEG